MTSKRLRTVGLLVLVLGLLAAGMYYWVEIRSAEPSEYDLFSDYSKEESRQIGILMGTFGMVLLGWVRALERPGTQAIIIAAASAVIAWACFRAARIQDEEEEEFAEGPPPETELPPERGP